MYSESTTIAYVIFFCLGMLVCAGVMLGGWISLAVGVYNDARGNYNPNPSMWGLLTGLLGTIPLIIYFCTRKNNFIKAFCPNCRYALPEPGPVCPYCRSAINLPPEDPAYIALRQKGKKQMITGGILYVAGLALFFVVYILFFVALFQNVSSLSGVYYG